MMLEILLTSIASFTNQWTSHASMPIARHHAESAVGDKNVAGVRIGGGGIDESRSLQQV